MFAEGNLDDHAPRLITLLRTINAGGCILLSTVNTEGVLAAIDRVAPLVQCAEYNERSALPHVGVDDFSAARSALRTLLAGDAAASLINGPDKYKYARQRYRGYADALREPG